MPWTLEGQDMSLSWDHICCLDPSDVGSLCTTGMMTPQTVGLGNPLGWEAVHPLECTQDHAQEQHVGTTYMEPGEASINVEVL